MEKPALFRNQRESLGYISFNRARNMYPNTLEFDKKVDGIFEQS